MKDVAERLLAFTVGAVGSFISWEALNDMIVSLVVAFAGGLLAHLGKMLAQAITAKCRSKKNRKHD